jgi:probable rRNA maturation factor
MSRISNVKLRNNTYNVMINVKEANWQKVMPNFHRMIDNTIKAVAVYVPLAGDISILLTNDAEMQTINKQYKKKDKPTNVLSFPQNEKGIIGDIIVSLETVQREAHEQEKSFYDHFSHMIVHGALHLMGYDHEKSKKAQKEMEELEVEILADLGVDNPFE